jgi:hypothetical protein
MEVKVNQDDLARMKRDLVWLETGFPKAFKRALDKTATGAKTDMVNDIRSKYNYKATALRKRMTVFKCPSYKTLNAKTRSAGPGIHLTDVTGTRQTKKGVTVNVKKETGRQLIPSAFISPGSKSKKPIVFIREKVGGRRVARLPISPIYAAHPEVVYNVNENYVEIQKAIDRRLSENMKHETDVVLRGIA